MIDAYAIVRRPLITEKGSWQSERNNVYAFEVDPNANKVQVRQAIKQLFDVDVVQVRTMVRRGKLRRRGFHLYETPSIKRALVTLREGQKIDFV